MNEYNTLQHTVWECKYHIVFVPKYRRRVLYKTIRSDLGPLFRELARQKGCSIEEGKIMRDHVHMLLLVPPKHSVSSVIGYIKGKSAIYISRRYRGKVRNFVGERLWARGYFVTTVGRDEEAIRNYIRTQEKEDIRLDQIPLFR